MKPVSRTVKVKADLLNGRIGPSMMFPIVIRMPRGRELKIIYEATSYGAAQLGDGVAWFHLDYLEDVAEDIKPDGFRWEAWPTMFQSRPGGGSPVNQPFGANPNIYQKYGLPGHEGLDLFLTMGSSVFSVAPGKVYQIEADPTKHNYGIHVRVRHADGYRSVYCHLSEVTVSVGDEVTAGQEIGKGGNTGNVWPKPSPQFPDKGTHLHLTMKRDGASVGGYPYQIIDPTQFMTEFLVK